MIDIDIIDGVLSMKMDIYVQKTRQTDSGQIIKTWIYDRTMYCHAKGTISNSVTARNGDRQIFDNRYKNDQMVQVRTKTRLSLKEKITNIRDSDGNPIWTEEDYPTDTPTVFELVGTTPITDPFGKIVAYNSALKRSENQTLGI